TFVAVMLYDIGVMGMETVPQLHFDGDPGVAAGTHGQPVLGGVLAHKIAPPSCCQLVQLGIMNFVPTDGHTILSISTLMNWLAPPSLVVSPQLSPAREVSNSWYSELPKQRLLPLLCVHWLVSCGLPPGGVFDPGACNGETILSTHVPVSALAWPPVAM